MEKLKQGILQKNSYSRPKSNYIELAIGRIKSNFGIKSATKPLIIDEKYTAFSTLYHHEETTMNLPIYNKV